LAGLFVFVQFVFVLIPPFWSIEGSGQAGENFSVMEGTSQGIAPLGAFEGLEHTIEKQGVERR